MYTANQSNMNGREMSQALRYRDDIDGLRAVAVLPVVLFHAGVSGLSGGYVGVDVFFVISGYLITAILLRGDASIVTFYQRRARRILPALFAVLAVVAVLGGIFMLPNDLAALGKSMVATIAFFSNMFFWRQAGYFKPEVELMPLLHTWSLGVEEQFYILFPFVVRYVRHWPARRIATLFTVLGAVSLAIAVYGIHMGQTQAVFYLLPTRAWELLAGAFLATNAVPRIESRGVRGGMAVVGLLGILVPCFTYTAMTPFPGIAAIPPVLGAALLILAGRDGDHAVRPLIANRPMVFVGLISYSLYLWHWPVMALLRYRLVREPTQVEMGLALVVIAALAILSWRFVERPFRAGFTDRRIWQFSAGGLAAAGVVAAVFIMAGGFPDRFPRAVVALNEDTGRTFKCPLTRMEMFGGTRACDIDDRANSVNDADVVLWGDSHAQMYAPAFRKALGKRHGIVAHIYSCAPVKSTDICQGRQKELYDALVASQSKTILMAQNWDVARDEVGETLGRDTRPDEKFAMAIARMRQTVAGLHAAGKNVILITPVPRPGFNVPSTISRERAFFGHSVHPESISHADYLREFGPIVAAMEQEARLPGVEVLRIDRTICRTGRCPFVVGDVAAFSDLGHLSLDYAATLTRPFVDALAAADTANDRRRRLASASAGR